MNLILIIDDNKFFCEILAYIIREQGHEAECAYTLTEGLETAKNKNYDVVFLDVQLPDGNGLDALPEVRKSPSQPEVIIITGMGNQDGAKLAIEHGAWDYIQKSDTLVRINLSLRRVLEYRTEKMAARPMTLRRGSIIGESPSLTACLDLSGPGHSYGCKCSYYRTDRYRQGTFCPDHS